MTPLGVLTASCRSGPPDLRGCPRKEFRPIRRDHTHVIDQICSEELTNGRRPSTRRSSPAASRESSALRRRGIDEMEGRTALHLDSRPRMGVSAAHKKCQTRDRHPTTLSRSSSPTAAQGSKLVAAHDLGTDACCPVAGEGLIGSVFRPARHASSGTCSPQELLRSRVRARPKAVRVIALHRC